MLFATAALTSTVVVICTAPRPALFSATSSPDNETGVTEAPFAMSYCNYSLPCPGEYGFTRCENHMCMCDENSYKVYNDTSRKTYCHLCSRFQESCAMNKCCQNPQATACINDVCVCRSGMEEECLSRYTPTLGIQLANTLSVSFAFVFLAITFIAVIRKTLLRCSFCRCDSMSRVASDSSLNEFIKHKMQDRPPCYDDIEKDRKVPIDTCSLWLQQQPPPEYGATHFGQTNTSRSAANRTLSISDEVEMHSAPPNYSTFTTVTDVTATIPGRSGSARNNSQNEIILTQPIYINRDSCLKYT
ncbi:uncharacterized protein LOC112685146 isoform X2 [Sipha flava]|uniref:Uncharacterized protein LOC112685146 isoform X2 n=1 Tax=Sipha flava TaxID=143950 RepID=A0A8B8FQU9_9HEMI|nr:uncharacterized protein LOC112685146 isoform X2 [Sipha flava]